MDSKGMRPPARRRLLLAAAAAGLIAVTAAVASSGAGATPFLPTVPGGTQANATDGHVNLHGVGEFPLLYASVGISSDCRPGLDTEPGCKAVPHVFTLTKPVDAATPVLAESAADGTRYRAALITIRSGTETAVTYTLSDVRVADDNQQFETASSGAATLKEQVTLAYSRIEWHVGRVRTGYDWARDKRT